MKNVLLIFLTIMGFKAFAGIEQAPENFKYRDSKAVFVDFKVAQYELSFSNLFWKSHAITNIEFYMPEDGHPIFDSVNNPTKVYVDGEISEQSLIESPDGAAKFRVINKEISEGNHIMSIYTPLKKGLWAGFFGVSSGFFIRDLKSRNFLEKYVPSNLEYDQYEMIFNVNVKHTLWRHRVFANGEVTKHGKNSFTVKFPAHYTASSVFFHLAPSHKYKVFKFSFYSIDGRKVPVTIYSRFWLRNWFFKRKTLRTLRELERDYGPYPHDSLVVYGTGIRGGMEYVAATETSYVSLGHELQHMYFAKGLMPADGNSGWMDEGIASWRDRGHKENEKPNYIAFNLGSHSQYQRKTDSSSYVKGRSFIGYLHYQLKRMGLPGMKDFLRGYQEKRMFTTVTTQDFISDLNEYSGADFNDDFKRYIFGKHPESLLKSRSPAVEESSPHHPALTEKELNSIL